MYLYRKEMYDYFKFPFKGLEEIEQSYSQALQDMFVLAVLDGKRDGLFLEIGAYEPKFISNTYLLEQFGWDGMSIDIDPYLRPKFEPHRRATFVEGDATQLDYSLLLYSSPKFRETNRIDYLQIDIEPATNTFKCLQRLPLDDYRFSVITYETDIYDKEISKETLESIQEESRDIFMGFGYILVNGNVENIGGDPFENWYLDAEYFDLKTIKKFLREDDSPMRARDYMLTKVIE